MYYIKKITVRTSDYGTSVLELKNGLNIIYGPSNTGKSLILECIDFMLGGAGEKLADSPVGFKSVQMILDVDGNELVLEREINSNDVQVTGDVPGIDPGIYKTTNAKKNTSKLWLSLMGIDDEVKVIKKMDYSPQTLGIRTFFHMFLIKESRMVSENSILKSGEGYNKNIPVPTVSSLIYLATDKNFLEGKTPTDSKIIDAKNLAIQQFVDRSLKTLADQRVEALSEEVAELTPAELNVKITETLNEIAATESSLDEVVEQSRRLADKIIEIDSQISECKMLKNRYRSLMSQYESDIKRLTFIAEGDLHRGDIPKLDHCPFCNGELTKAQGESCVEAAIAEVQKIEAQIRDLRAANIEIVAEIKELDNERVAVIEERKAVQDKIRIELEPKISSLRGLLFSYRAALGKAKVNEIFDKVESTLNEELRDSLEDKKESEKFDVRGKIREFLAPELDVKLLEILRAVNYENISSATLDIEKCDVKVNGTAKSTQGKGFRAFLNAVMAIAVQEFLVETGIHPTWFLAFDSPILSLVEKQDPGDKLASDIMRKGLFTYLVKNTKGKQIIVVENYIPEIDYHDTNIIHFTKTSEGRYGFVERYHK
ncbi:MAG: AAA family ATPase [Dorea sp.]|nr:AAA family ATPase [Dorea sp.]